jgi:hypothetical protein
MDQNNEKPDRPTDEAMQHYEGYREEPVSAAAGAKTRMRRLDASEIDRLYMRGSLTQDQHTTLQEFTQDLYEAGLVFCPKAGLVQSGTSGHAQFIADHAFRRVKRVSRQMEILAGGMNDAARMIVMSALTDDRKVSPKNEGLMKYAADVLADFYDPRASRLARTAKIK